MLKNSALQRVLETCTSSSTDQDGGNVVYALFLEPNNKRKCKFSSWDSILETAIETFQPNPALMHCELLVPPVPSDDERISFATYIGRKSAWQTDKMDSLNYYLIENIDRWRAVPIFELNAANRVRRECDNEIGVEYSMVRYLTAFAPLRWTSKILTDTRRSPAHCATLVARVLKNSAVHELARPTASYGPSLLYNELIATATQKACSVGSAYCNRVSEKVEADLDMLLRGVMSSETIAEIGDEGCKEVVKALTSRTCSALLESEASMQRMLQKQLATALLRWSILRDGT